MAAKKQKQSGGSGGSGSSLLAELQSTPPASNNRGRWEDSVPPATRAELDAIRAAILAGAIKHSQRAIHRFLREKGVIKVTFGAFRNYLERV